MKSYLKLLCSIFLFLEISTVLNAQSVRGYIYSTENSPVPYVNIYAKHTNIGTTTDEHGRYFIRFIEEGDYELIISAIGYETRVIKIVVENKEVVKNVWLNNSVMQLEQVEVKDKRRDPAYEIINLAIDARKDNNKQVNSYRCQVYIKAKENISEKEKRRREKQKEQEEIEDIREDDVVDEIEIDPVEIENQELQKQKAERMRLANSMNMA